MLWEADSQKKIFKMKKSSIILLIICCGILIYIFSICMALGVSFGIRKSIIEAYKLTGGAMEPTLIGSAKSKNHPRTTGDHILAKKYGIKNIYQGEIIVFQYPYDMKKDYVKRIIGMPGDTIQIINKKVYNNSKKLKEPWLKFGERHFNSNYTLSEIESTRDNLGPLIIPKKGDIIKLISDKIYINDKFVINKKISSLYSKEKKDNYFYLYKISLFDKNRNIEDTLLQKNKEYIVKYD